MNTYIELSPFIRVKLPANATNEQIEVTKRRVLWLQTHHGKRLPDDLREDLIATHLVDSGKRKWVRGLLGKKGLENQKQISIEEFMKFGCGIKNNSAAERMLDKAPASSEMSTSSISASAPSPLMLLCDAQPSLIAHPLPSPVPVSSDRLDDHPGEIKSDVPTPLDLLAMVSADQAPLVANKRKEVLVPTSASEAAHKESSASPKPLAIIIESDVVPPAPQSSPIDVDMSDTPTAFSRTSVGAKEQPPRSLGDFRDRLRAALLSRSRRTNKIDPIRTTTEKRKGKQIQPPINTQHVLVNPTLIVPANSYSNSPLGIEPTQSELSTSDVRQPATPSVPSTCEMTPDFIESCRIRSNKKDCYLTWTILERNRTHNFDEWLSELLDRMQIELTSILEKERGARFEVTLRIHYFSMEGIPRFTNDVSGGQIVINSLDQLAGTRRKVLEKLRTRQATNCVGYQIGRIESGAFRVLEYRVPNKNDKRRATRDAIEELIRTGSTSIAFKKGELMVRVLRDGKIMQGMWWCTICRKIYSVRPLHLKTKHHKDYQVFQRAMSIDPHMIAIREGRERAEKEREEMADGFSFAGELPSFC